MSDFVAKFSIDETEPIKATFKAYDEPPSIGGTTDYEWLENKPSINGVTLVNDLTLDDLSIQPKGDYANKSDIPTKTSDLENNSNFATVSDIPQLLSQLENDLGYQTLTDVMGIIASIPQFKLEVVDTLPETGEKMTLYLVSNGSDYGDVYYEFIWIEQTTSYELIGSTAIDLTLYVKNTDYASATKAGVIKVMPINGIKTETSGQIKINTATTTEIDAKTNLYKPITPSNLNYAVNSVLPTMTQAEYDALTTKDENLFYMIIEG